MFFTRAAGEDDLPGVVEIARHLDSVNLPDDPEQLAGILRTSGSSFAGTLEPAKRELTFALVERASDGAEQVVGVSMIFAQHGTPLAPHTFFDVLDEERYSELLDRHFRHTILRIGYNYRGVTEVGGLVLLPGYRGHAERLGMLLSYTRFMYLARHRDLFRDEILSELMPPLEEDGTSLLWESLGRNFTGLSYQQADRLSRRSKEFIRSLFPQDPIYATLLPPPAQALVGQVGPSTKPVERMLRRIGFKYAHRIDPFDGGPHFHALTDEVTVVRDTRSLVVREVSARPDATAGGVEALVAVDRGGPPFFQAVKSRVRVATDGVVLPADAAAALDVHDNDTVAVYPLSDSAP